MNTEQVSAALGRLDAESPLVLVLVEASALRSQHFPPFPLDQPALVLGVHSRETATDVQQVLLAAYPDDHELRLLAGSSDVRVTLSALPSTGALSDRTCLYVPPLAPGTSLESFAEVVARLRAPDGCPWDRQQTHETLRPHLLEETYEALEAIDASDSAALREELGDLLLQIVLHAQIASEGKRFSMPGVLQSIRDKIIRRHPHVFGDVQLDGVTGVLQNWERLKEHERMEQQADSGLLDGVPSTLPALAQAQEYQDRAARVGFDWPEIGGVLDKIREEIDEIRQAESPSAVTAEMGDLFFVLVNLARWKGADAESVLRGANARFKRRFGYIESVARQQGRRLTELGLEEMESLWQAAKAAGDESS